MSNEVSFFAGLDSAGNGQWTEPMRIAGRTRLESAEHAIAGYYGGYRARRVREVAPGQYRGLVGRRCSVSVTVRPLPETGA